MYQHFYGLERMPFNTTPDTRFFFHSEQHQEALSSLLYAVNERKGFTLLTGEIGAGKTTVCRAFLNRLDPDTKVAVITNTRLTERQLLQAICEEYGLWIPGNVGKVTLFNELNTFLVDQYRQGANVVCLSGLARKGELARSAQALGLNVVDDLCYPDHHRFTAAEWRAAERRADACDGGLVVSAKDAVRLSPEQKAQVRILEVDWKFLRGESEVTARLLLAARKGSA